MSGKDNDLLARLNALKPSSVTFDPARASSTIDVEVSRPQTVEDKLADRLKSLRSGASVTTAARTTQASPIKDPVPAQRTIADANIEHKDPITHWQQNGNDEDKTLDDLLADIGPEDQWKLDPDDPQAIASLLQEAKESLPKDSEGNPEATNDADEAVAGDETAAEDGTEVGEAERGEQREADDYVKRVLAELEIENKYGSADAEVRPSQDKQDGTNLDLPATPSDIRQTQPSVEPPSYEDSELEARFSKLGLDLPSTPTNIPSSKAKKAAKTGLDKLNQAKSKPNLPVYTDEDIDSWCCICNEDGEVRCLGCDGDIYCQNCWRDGHGTGPGQERGHKAVQYNKRGPAATAA